MGATTNGKNNIRNEFMLKKIFVCRLNLEKFVADEYVL